MTMGKVKWGGFLLESIKQIALWKEEKNDTCINASTTYALTESKLKYLQERIINAVRPRTSAFL